MFSDHGENVVTAVRSLYALWERRAQQSVSDGSQYSGTQMPSLCIYMMVALNAMCLQDVVIGATGL